jgi:hypothetical protein
MERTKTGLTLEELSKIKEVYTEFTPEQANITLKSLENDLKIKMEKFPISPDDLLYPLDVIRPELLKILPPPMQIEMYLHAEARLEFSLINRRLRQEWKERKINYDEFRSRTLDEHNRIYGLLLPANYTANPRIYQ